MVYHVFGKSSCKNCETLKTTFDNQGVEYEYHKVDNLYQAEKYCREHMDDSFELDDVKVFPFLVDDETTSVYTYEDIVNTLVEPVLFPREDRYTLFPIKYDNIYDIAKKQRACFWNPEEIDFSKDYEDWNTLDENTKHFIKHILAFFASADGIVLENLMARFSREIKIPEAIHAFALIEAIEAIHSETYSLLIDTYVKDHQEKMRLFNGVKEIASIRRKGQWMTRWLGGGSSFATRLLISACVEGIMFSGSFCAIFWLKKQGKMPGLAFANELISRDEGLHAEHSVRLFHHLKFKPPENTIKEIVGGAVDEEKSFILDALQCKMIGMNEELMGRYVEFVADRLLTQLGCDKLYNVDNPFDWMENISLEGKTNFFEKRVGEYQKSGVMTNNDRIFEISEDF